MTSPLHKAGWDAYLRTRHAKVEKRSESATRKLAADRAYARMLMERVEARRRAMLRKST